MNIEYKKLTSNELDIFINMRINQLREEGAKEEVDCPLRSGRWQPPIRF